MHILSSCAGDGRDVLGVLADRDDADRVTATLVEVHPRIAERARAAAAALAHVEVRTVDAGDTDAYLGAVPAELVLMVGIHRARLRDDRHGQPTGSGGDALRGAVPAAGHRQAPVHVLALIARGGEWRVFVAPRTTRLG